MKRLIFTLLAASLLAPAAWAEDEAITRLKRDMPGLWANQHCGPVSNPADTTKSTEKFAHSVKKSALPVIAPATATPPVKQGTATNEAQSLY